MFNSRAIYSDLLILVFIVLFSFQALMAQESILEDINGDGEIILAAFGDSITYGVGDTAYPLGGGYIFRVGLLAGVTTENLGVPGEEIGVGGMSRFPTDISASRADIVVILEGTNDAVHQRSTSDLRLALQRVINVANVLGKKVVVMTYPTPCCDHGSLAPFTTSYSFAVREIAAANEITQVDLERIWNSTCNNKSECELYNLPEGLHPNGTGYDVIAQGLSAGLLGIDILSVDGASQLEGALGLEPGTVLVKPEGL